MGLEEKTKEMTLAEKAKMLSGYKNMATYPLDRLNIPSLTFSDGPNGLRVEDKNANSLNGISNSLPSTCFPSGVSLASSFNRDLTYQVGQAIAKEAIHYGINIVLGPAINIKRNPLCGRNFEYYSEDPLLSGKIGASYVLGMQKDSKVGSCVKHFACNNNEKYRFTGDSIVDERALREIYLKPFEILIKEAKPYAIMTAYNKVNGTHCSENVSLQKEILREEWAFDGLSMTDWGGIVNRDSGLKASTDLEMPGQVNHSITLLQDKVKQGELKESLLDESVGRILKAIEKTRTQRKDADFEKNYALSVKAAQEGSVLLKNEGLLPLKKEESYLVIGDFFQKIRYQGSGSALLNPYKLKSHKDIFDENNVSYDYLKGFAEESQNVTEALEKEVLDKIKDDDRVILFFGGLNDYVESEGFDRDDMKIPKNQISLLKKIFALNKKVVLILHNGSQVEMDELEKSSAILDLLLPGEGGAMACYDLLFGNVSPSGRLAETWVRKYEDVPFHDAFAKSENELYYESIYVGYRYYLEHKDLIRYPFGFGLSYTDFEYSDFSLEKKEEGILITFNLKNIGEYDGKEVIQVYVSHNSKLPHPLKELKGFDKVMLKKGESKEVSLLIPYEDLKVYDVKRKAFLLEKGDYTFYLQKDCLKEIQKKTLFLEGQEIENSYPESVNEIYQNAKSITSSNPEIFEQLLGRKINPIKKEKKITMETRISDYTSLFGRFFRYCVCAVGMHTYKKGCKMKDSTQKERVKKSGLFTYRLMPNNSLRSLCYSSSGMFKYNVACGIKEMVNHHFFKGLFIMCKKDK